MRPWGPKDDALSLRDETLSPRDEAFSPKNMAFSLAGEPKSSGFGGLSSQIFNTLRKMSRFGTVVLAAGALEGGSVRFLDLLRGF